LTGPDRAKHKGNELPSALQRLVDKPEDSSWGDPHFSNCNVLSVLETAFDVKVQPTTHTLPEKACHTKPVTDAGVQCSIKNRRTILQPPGGPSGLYQLILSEKSVLRNFKR